MRKYKFYILLLISSIVHSQNDENKYANDFVKEKIEIVESVHKNDSSDIGYLEAIDYLEELTKIKSCHQYGIEQNPFKYAIVSTISDWKKWLFLNKNNIFLLKNSDIVEFREPIILLDKNPQEEFIKHFNVVKTNIRSDIKDFGSLYCAYDFFTSLIHSDPTDLEFGEDFELILPTESYLEKINNWYIKNRQDLIWDIGTQQLTLQKK